MSSVRTCLCAKRTSVRLSSYELTRGLPDCPASLLWRVAVQRQISDPVRSSANACKLKYSTARKSRSARVPLLKNASL